MGEPTAVWQRKAWRVTGTLSIVLVMIGGGLQTWAMVVQQRTTSVKPYDVSIHKVKLDTGSASVRVRAGREGHVVVRQNLDWMVRKPVVSTTVDGDVLTVGMRCRQILPFADFGCGAQIELEVPAATEVSGAVSSGFVEVDGLSGDVRMDLTSGELRLIGTSGEVDAHATSGMVQGIDLSAERVNAEVGSGSVELDFAKAPHSVDTRTTSGSVRMSLPKDTHYAFTGESGSGSRSIDANLADASSPNRIHASVGSGSIRIGPA
ncbi:hypothetical protein P3T27_002183 [Kitasatospora sp. MAA19]|uniref:DUF4097 family beta strand repeat-containing protein n=1 Tax=Kitasatospora sp. MAA19 TaxID=3035090 RepID=UPI002476CB05|nr:DUF4097 family beta strand repeat-containing protein [Kitasatospora sp. MAA19]MDH6705473.1 hypothetical protein [Kitasatospora sp. MAA19]